MPTKWEGGNFVPGNGANFSCIKEYVDDRVNVKSFEELIVDAKKITLSFDMENTEILLDKMDELTLHAFLAHVNKLKLHIEKRLFEKS